MPLKFQGTYEALQEIVLVTGIFGDWRDLGHQRQFRTENGAVLNWWPATGTLTFQGRYPEWDELKERVVAQIEFERRPPIRHRDPSGLF